MKTNVTYTCGHKGTKDIDGRTADGKRTLAILKETGHMAGACPDCRKKAFEEAAVVLGDLPRKELRELLVAAVQCRTTRKTAIRLLEENGYLGTAGNIR